MRRKAERGRRPARSRQSADATGAEASPSQLFDVTGLGGSGDGLARPVDPSDGGDLVFIPFTAPGDRVLARRTGHDRAVAEQIIVPGSERVEPPCSLFGQCGGCALQHLSTTWTLDWKKDRLLTGLRKAGVSDIPFVRTTQTGPYTRRRAELALRRKQGTIIIGLHQRGGDPVDLTECHLLHPALTALLPPLRELLAKTALLKREGDLLINLLDSGPDLLFSSDANPGTADRSRFATFAVQHAIPRIAWRRAGTIDVPEILTQIAPTRIRFGDTDVEPPPGAFLQASRDGEIAIQAAVIEALPRIPGKKARVIELYAGCGTLTFPLAEHIRVEAFEGHAAAVRSLQQASAGKRIAVTLRDLNRQPVEARELGSALAVIIDPPHSGAGMQMTQILDGKPGVLIYVSCNPKILFRDTVSLLAKGYRLDSIALIDQFLWSAEIETVCRFSRK
ncbi:class I SAM-dependent RNA methyltransferase [Acetobacter fallax]|uniref:Class I SAM-dependent RNA methyltransferase n=1 Tax=Acetobacter fallax TaxID=1737473 RepID=A0ABX0K9W3_9PROT|nr:class I SAM-dependent RNA methyltransferase [Acetobacter fallax]NHO31983.1 class I SAM-dependent RNA methyltransferase [Acetobacter fallax]NHO35501.1 class I SAM-dependent RNA methyltransferase [Acetobacter fallax]